MLRPPLDSLDGVEFRDATALTVLQVEATAPSLEPRKRLELAIAREAGSRAEVLLHSYVTTRMKKILSGPSVFLSKAMPSTSQSNDPQSRNNPRSRNDCPSDRQKNLMATGEDYNQLETAFAEEVRDLWIQHQVYEPDTEYSSCDGPFVHAHICDQSIPFDAFQHFSSTDLHRRLLHIFSALQRPPRVHSSQASISRTSQQRSTNDSQSEVDAIAPANVLTINFNTVRHIVEDGRIKLTG